jgi:hypothetical protein
LISKLEYIIQRLDYIYQFKVRPILIHKRKTI